MDPLKQGHLDYACGLYCVLTLQRAFLRSRYERADKPLDELVAEFRPFGRGHGGIEPIGWGAGLGAMEKLAQRALCGDDERPQRVARGSMAALGTACPAIAFIWEPTKLRDKHYVVVSGVTGTHVEVIDPSPHLPDVRPLTRRQFLARWRHPRLGKHAGWAIGFPHLTGATVAARRSRA